MPSVPPPPTTADAREIALENEPIDEARFVATSTLRRDLSSDRRRTVGSPTPPPRAATAAGIRREQVRLVGRRFLQLRPWIVAPAALVNGIAIATSGAPLAQRALLAASLGVTVALFVVEAWITRRRPVGERWFLVSLAATLAALTLGAGLSGGLASPLVPLLFAPVVVSFAAFGRARPTSAMLGCALVAAIGLALIPAGAPFPPLPAASALPITLVSLVTSLALAFTGVGALVEAHARATEDVERLRLAALEASASRVRDVEQVSATVAHELKNPLGAVRAIVQILAEKGGDDRTRRRLDVALGEVDRMRAIVDDYIAFARPLVASRAVDVDLRDLAREVADLFESRAAHAGVAIVVEGDRASVVADAARLREALANLVENAIHASPKGGHVSIAIDATDDLARVRVVDRGAGLPDAIARAPGAPFVTTKPGGAGLGIAIAQGSIAQLGGALTFGRGDAGGAVATVSLPRVRETRA